MDFEEHNLGQESPRVAIVGAVHGDEILGKKVIEQLKTIKLIKGSLGLIVAHPTAIKHKKRFIETDLNRSFPGKEHGSGEVGLAYKLHQRLKSFDVVIDIHSTNAKAPSLAIITSFNQKTKDILKLTPVTQVALARQSVFGGHELIAHHPAAISLDYGPKKDSAALKQALGDTKEILRGLGMISGQPKHYPKKEIFILSGQYHVKNSFKYSRDIAELQHISKNEIIGYEGAEPVKARYDFYPMFLHDGRYEGTFALAAKTKKVVNL